MAGDGSWCQTNDGWRGMVEDSHSVQHGKGEKSWIFMVFATIITCCTRTYNILHHRWAPPKFNLPNHSQATVGVSQPSLSISITCRRKLLWTMCALLFGLSVIAYLHCRQVSKQTDQTRQSFWQIVELIAQMNWLATWWWSKDRER